MCFPYGKMCIRDSGTAPQLFEDVQPGLLAYAASNVQIKDFVDALDRGSADSIYDINQDGTVDLADLQRLYDCLLYTSRCV